MENQSHSDETKPRPEGKLPYSRPELTKHGRMEEITQKAGLTIADGMTGSGIL